MKKKSFTRTGLRKTESLTLEAQEALVREFGRAWAHCASPQALERFVNIIEYYDRLSDYIRCCEQSVLGLVDQLYFDVNGPDGDMAVLFGKAGVFWCRMFGTDTPLIHEPKVATAFVESVLQVWRDCQAEKRFASRLESMSPELP